MVKVMKNQPVWFDDELRSALNKKTSSEVEQGYFVYHLDRLKDHLEKLQKQEVVKLWFAVKANPLSKVLQTLDSAGFDFDVASTGELNQVLSQGVSARRVLNTGPAKSKKQLASFISKGVRTFVVESMNQLKWLNEVVIEQEETIKPAVLLRVQLQWPEGEKNPLGGNTLTPFGLSVEEWRQIHVSQFPHLNICGLHIFQWGNMLNNEKMFSLWSQMVDPLKKLAEDIGMQFDILDLGGGLGIDYLEQGESLCWHQSMKDLALIKANSGVNELWLELGRFAVAECGQYVVEVVDRKTNFEEEQLVLSAGINHLLRPAITEQPFPVTLLSAKKFSEKKFFHIHGPLCTSLDKLGSLLLPQNTQVGDKLVFGYCGAYGFTESMPFFLCHQLAAEYVFKDGQLSVVREAEPADAYLA
jgi:diaminopimelate decarboxylase